MMTREKAMAAVICFFSFSVMYQDSSMLAENPGGSDRLANTAFR